MRARAEARAAQHVARAPAGPGRAGPGRAPPAVDRALAEPSAPIARTTLASIERRFDFSSVSVLPPAREAMAIEEPGSASEREAEAVAARPGSPRGAPPDFRDVRLHTGPAARQAAAAINAAAFTVGRSVVLGESYEAGTREGEGLLAHELAHVAQGARGGPPVVRRRSLLERIGIFFGFTEGSFDDAELSDYLAGVEKTGKIEDRYDSDNKARAIVRRWMVGASQFHLKAPQMVLLIREMDTGYVGDEDQDGILDLLTHAENGDLRHIFAPSQIDPKRLESDFGGKRRDRLRQFYDVRFRGGRAALYGGTVEPLGGPAMGTPVFAWDWSFFRGRLEDSDYHDDELAAELSRLSDADRDRAIKDLAAHRMVLQRAFTEAVDKFAAEPDAAKKAALRGAIADIGRKRQRVDDVQQRVWKDIALNESQATMLAKTRLPTAAEKTEIGKALKPDVRASGLGVALPFVPHIVGEAKTYKQKIRDLMPAMIQGYWDDMVKDKEAAEHADPTKVHKLTEFEPIANAAKEATDRVFSGYAAPRPAFRADRPPPAGRGQLHDLFADMERDLAAMGNTAKRDLAKALIFYFFQSDGAVEAINRHHNASPRFSNAGAPLNAEATDLDALATNWVSSMARVKKLNEIDRNWDASANPITHEVNLQIFKKATVPEDRRFLWDMYQTLIHEYLHTLVHPDYGTFADGFGSNSLENNTLMEGVDSLLTETVWQDARSHVAEPAVRAKVEGPTYSLLPFDPAVVPDIHNRRYASYTQAVKLVNVVGIRNLYAAYFLGKVDLIRP